MYTIELEGILIYAFHGCLSEEACIGSHYRADLCVWTDFSAAAETDSLSDTEDYTRLNQIVHREMAVRSNLLEHVACRIVRSVFRDFPRVSRARIRLAKINPPLPGQVHASAVTVELSREESEC